MTDEEFRALLNVPMPLHPVRWNPNTSSYEPFNYSDDQRGESAADESKERK